MSTTTQSSMTPTAQAHADGSTQARGYVCRIARLKLRTSYFVPAISLAERGFNVRDSTPRSQRWSNCHGPVAAQWRRSTTACMVFSAFF